MLCDAQKIILKKVYVTPQKSMRHRTIINVI